MFKTLRKKGITKEDFFLYKEKFILILKNFSSTKFYKDLDKKA